MSFSSHEIVLTSSPDGPITAYDTISGTTLARFTGSRSPRHGLAIVGKAYIAASHISSATASGSIHLYTWWSSSALHHLPLPEPVAPLAATPDGSYLFAGGLFGNVYALSIPSGNILKSFPAHSKPVSCINISSDSSLLISGGDDGNIVVVPIFQLVEAPGSENESNLILHSFPAHDGPVTGITVCMGICHPTIVSCSTDSTCKLWSLLDGRNLQTVAFPCSISGIALDPTEVEFYAAGSNGLIYKGSLQAGSRKGIAQGRKLITWTQKHDGAVVSVVVINEGKNLVSAAEDGSVFIWGIENGQLIMVIGNNMDNISDVVVARGICDGREGYGNRVGNEMNEFGGRNLGLSSKELNFRPIKDTVNVENALAVAAKNSRKAIDKLESAIGVYERLLELILKEAKAGTSKNGEN
ncbi:WD-repeat protein, putative [Ricinus communis]|uniref:WD-repeat protein, putative n=2 Tax=Ricinus communis TaxID=3988 RepID=B9T1J9_RICCO|nr:WD-repeat protein, putative [Ricinus communis]